MCVLDAEAPSLSCPDRVFQTANGNSTATNLPIIPYAWDNVDSSPEVECSHTSQDVLHFGDTMVSCHATDYSGNVAECNFIVTIEGKGDSAFAP